MTFILLVPETYSPCSAKACCYKYMYLQARSSHIYSDKFYLYVHTKYANYGVFFDNVKDFYYIVE